MSKKPKFILKNSCLVKTNDKILVYGEYRTVRMVRHLNRHPIQLYEFFLNEFNEPLRVPDGWQIRVLDEEPVREI